MRSQVPESARMSAHGPVTDAARGKLPEVASVRPTDRAAVSQIDRLLTSRPLILVTGKGGVGKSSVSAALALRAVALGLKPLLFECDAPARQSLFPGGARSSDEVREILPGLYGVNQSSDEAIKAYAIHALPSRTLAELLLENRVARLFLKASPSVTEMALIGRMVQLAEERAAEGPVIVDLHSTGHALHVLRAPLGIMRVLRKGPVYERAKIANDFVFDPARTAVIAVALPEELPVTELLEVLAQLDDMKTPLGPVVLNGMFADPLPGVPDALLERVRSDVPEAARASTDAKTMREWARRAARERTRLLEGLSTRRGDDALVLSLPFMLDLDAAEESVATRLADHIDAISKDAPHGAARSGARDGG